MSTRKINAAKQDDITSLCEHIEGHIGWLKEALTKGDRKALREQAAEIEAWGQSLRQTAEKV